MKKKMTAKKGGKRKRKGKNGNNVTMEEGPNRKYDKVYNEAFGFHIKLKPDDRTPASKHMTQDKRRCAAAKGCKCTSMPLSTRHRCIVCAFCVHPEYGIELEETGVHKIPSSSINLVCKSCSYEEDMDKFVSNGELSLRHYVINKYLRPQYPKIELVMLEEEDVTSESDSGSDDEDNEEDNEDKMDIDDEKGNTKESKETEANKDKENDEMEVDDSKKDEKPTEQSTKERTDNSDEESVLASNKTRNNNKDSSPKDNEVQLEPNLYGLTSQYP